MDLPALPSSVRLVAGVGGLPRFEILTQRGEAHIYLHGAHVTHFAPAGEKPVLFLSKRSHFAPGKAIRGGVPVIFPWFGPKAGDPSAAAHGFARTREWVPESVTELPGGSVVIALRLDSTPELQALWGLPDQGAEWTLRHRITVDEALTMELEIENRGSGSLRFEEALHSYFTVSDVRDIEVRGLEGAEYLDKVDALRRKRQPNAPIRFEAETDRTYVNTQASCVISDPGLHRRILIEKTASSSTIVWNPWTAKAAAMADVGDEEWKGMVCVETGNAADNALELAPGTVHTTRTVVRTERI